MGTWFLAPGRALTFGMDFEKGPKNDKGPLHFHVHQVEIQWLFTLWETSALSWGQLLSLIHILRKNEADQPLEKVGSELRKLYSWNDTDKLINN